MRLQKAPIGLLGSLDLKLEGANPAEFADQIVGLIDVADYYGLLQQRAKLTTGNVQNVGDTLSLTVPDGYLWRVHSLGFRLAAIQAADDCSAFIGWRVGDATSIAPLAVGPMWSGLAHNDNLYCVAAHFSRPLLVPGGSQLFGYLAAAQGAGAVAASLTAVVNEYQL